MKQVVGLALAGGAAKGFAHIGVLKALEEHNIRVDLVSGCSIGALIGGMYCAGISPTDMELMVRDIKWRKLIDLTIPTLGVIRGKKIQDLLIELVGYKNIEDLERGFLSISTDLSKSSKYVFKKGPLHTAIRASIAFPGVFEPVMIDDMILVDGGLIDLLPVDELWRMNTDRVIAVDLGTTLIDKENLNIVDVLVQSVELLTEKIQKSRTLKTDIIISPKLDNIGPSRFDLVEDSINLGYCETIKNIEEIKKCIEKEK